MYEDRHRQLCDQDLVGSLSAVVMSEAIKRAVYSADSAYGFKSAKDIKN